MGVIAVLIKYSSLCAQFELIFWPKYQQLIMTKLIQDLTVFVSILYAASAGMRESVGSTTSFFHTSMVVHHESDNHLHIRKFIHKGLLSSLSKKQQNVKVSMNNTA